jgi:thiol-disulfide isomerase/thioredoxin
MKVSKKELFLYFFAAVMMFGVPFFINGSPISGKPPQISGITLSGQKISLADHKPHLIYFWAEWCGVCRMTQPAVSAVLKNYSGLTIAVKSGKDKLVKNYLSQQGLNWLTLNDEHGKIAYEYGVQGVPSVFILNPDGEVAFAISGYCSELGLRLRLWLAEYK